MTSASRLSHPTSVDLISSEVVEKSNDIHAENQSAQRRGALIRYARDPASLRQSFNSFARVKSGLEPGNNVKDARAAYACIKRAQTPRASSTRPDIAWHAAKIIVRSDNWVGVAQRTLPKMNRRHIDLP